MNFFCALTHRQVLISLLGIKARVALLDQKVKNFSESTIAVLRSSNSSNKRLRVFASVVYAVNESEIVPISRKLMLIKKLLCQHSTEH